MKSQLKNILQSAVPKFQQTSISDETPLGE